MSSDTNLQEMEAGTTQSKTAVNAGAKAADPMQKLAPGAVAGESGSYEDLGGPTPDNYKSDDESAKLKTPGATLKQVKDVVNKGAKAADAMKGMKEEEELNSEEVIEEDEEITAEAEEVVSEEEATEEEVVSEEETSEEEVVAEAEEIEEFDVSEDVNALLDGEELSEEFQEKARTIFEAALRSKVEVIREGLSAAYDKAYEEKLVDEMETKLNEQIEKNIVLNSRLSESVADGIFDEVTEGLALSQKEKLASLTESVEFESAKTYREKLEMLKESYFSAKKAPKAQTENLSEEVDIDAAGNVPDYMNNYLRTLGAVSKK